MKFFLLLVTVFILFSCDDEPDLTRNSPEVCDDERPNQTFNPANVPTTNGNPVYCDSDSDCTEGLNGRCVGQLGASTRYCDYDECFNDDDCGSDQACSCGKDLHENFSASRSDANSCVVAECRTNDDCGDEFCKPDHGDIIAVGDRVRAFYCTTENDECRNDSDCSERSRCTFGDGKWFCRNGGDG